MSNPSVEWTGKLFRVEHEFPPGRDEPYEFIRRRGAVTMMPVLQDGDTGRPKILTIINKRLHYGTSCELPGGNLDGPLDALEHPAKAALRELGEETGYVAKGGLEDVQIFALRTLSRTIRYPRYFAIVRNVVYNGGEVNNPDEQVTVRLVDASEYLEGFFELGRGELYPEVNAAFGRAAMIHGRDAVVEWVGSGEGSDVPGSFKPWLTLIANGEEVMSQDRFIADA
jgi:8-oxo-dGTP pyrophosphatase MutT (NUDIX family)